MILPNIAGFVVGFKKMQLRAVIKLKTHLRTTTAYN